VSVISVVAVAVVLLFNRQCSTETAQSCFFFLVGYIDDFVDRSCVVASRVFNVETAQTSALRLVSKLQTLFSC